jgi:peroxiredoxin
MKRILLQTFLAVAICFAAGQAFAAETKDAKAELKELVTKIQTVLNEKKGKPTKDDLAPYLKEFDTLLASHQGEKTDEVAQIVFMKAMLFLQFLDDEDTGKKLLAQLKSDYPDSKPGKQVDQILTGIEKQKAAKEIQKKLAVGTVFPDFQEQDLDGKPLSIANYKGKIVLVDFWATWCGPCVGELPNVLKAYEKYHAQGFEIIGVSLDNKAEDLKNFIKTKGVVWPQYFDGKGWQSKLAGVYGIMSIPATYLLDGEGKIVAKDGELRGDGLAKALAKLLDK